MSYAQTVSLGTPIVVTKVVAVCKPMVLSHHYDDRQQWFDFVVAIISSPVLLEKLRLRSYKKVYAITDDRHRKMFSVIKGLDQFPLPFAEHLNLSKRKYDEFARTAFPGFARNENDQIYSFKYGKMQKKQLTEWCLENCRSFYHIGSGSAFFAHPTDRALASLVV